MVRLRPKNSKEWHEQQQDAPSVSSQARFTQKWTEQQATAAAPAVTGSPIWNGHATSGQTNRCERWQSLIRWIVQKTQSYKPPTDEELAKEKKKQKREQIFPAIGDGISTLELVLHQCNTPKYVYR